jgi:hypothetical protein
MHCLSKIWYRMSNKNQGFIRQITVKEMRTRHYREMCQELAKGQTMHTPDTRNVHQEATSNPHSPTAPASEDVSPGDPTERYQIAKTHASSYNIGEWLHQNQGDPALRVSPRFPVQRYLCIEHDYRSFDVASSIICWHASRNFHIWGTSTNLWMWTVTR